jgi:hypothetical protein
VSSIDLPFLLPLHFSSNAHPKANINAKANKQATATDHHSTKITKIMNISSSSSCRRRRIIDIDDDSDTDDMYCRGRIRDTTQKHAGDAPVELHSRSLNHQQEEREGISAHEVMKRKNMDINPLLGMSRKVSSAALSSTPASYQHPIYRSLGNSATTSVTTSCSAGLRSLLFQPQPSFLVSTTTRSTATMTRAQMMASAFEIIEAAKVSAAPTLALARPPSAPAPAATASGTICEMDHLSPSASDDLTDNEQEQQQLLQQQQQAGDDGYDTSTRSCIPAPAESLIEAETATEDNYKVATVALPTKLYTTTKRSETVWSNNEIHAMFRRRKKFMFLKHVEN